MRAMIVSDPAARSPESALVSAADMPVPAARVDEVLVKVSVCGVCRTDLDVAEGRVAAPGYPVIPGHQIVGSVAAVGRDVADRREGDRVGIAWIHDADGTCRWCRRGEENLCPS